MHEAFQIVLPLCCSVLLLACAAPWPVRALMSKAKPETKKRLKPLLKYLLKHHVQLAAGLAVAIVLHIAYCAFSLHKGSFSGAALMVLIILLAVNGSRKANKRWLHVHRTLCAVALAVFAVHVATGLAGL